MSILAASDEELPVFAELDGRHAVLVALERVNIASFEQVENFGESVVGAGDQEVARRVEVEAVDAGVEDPVILDQLAHLQVENLHARVLLRHGDDVVVAVPAQLVSEAFLVLKRVDQLARFDVEDFQRFVLGGRCDHLVVGREASAADPVGVTGEGGDEVALGESEHLDGFIFARGYQTIARAGEVNGTNRRLVRDDLLRVAFVHLRFEDVHHLRLSYYCQQALHRPVDIEHLVILLKFQTARILLSNGVNRNGLVERGSGKLIVVRAKGE